MKIILILFFLLPCISNGLTFKDGEEVDNSQSNRTSKNSTNIETLKSENKSFKPFECSKLDTEHLRINNLNNCLIVQELSNKYEVKSQDFDTNTWNSPLLLRYIYYMAK